MASLFLTLAIGYYDRTAPLADGRVRAEGIDLDVLFKRPEDIFWGMTRHLEYDVAEMSLSTLIMLHSRGSVELVGIPVFPSRVFRHSSLYVNSSADIDSPEDLRGRRVGIAEYQITASLWVRALLQHQYGVFAHEIKWLNGGLIEAGRREKIELTNLPSNVDLSYIGDGQNLNDMLVSGEIDALVTPLPPPAFSEGRPEVSRLFTDVKAEEISFYRQTGFFPPMHTVVMRRSVFEAHPWVANSLMAAFVEAKKHGDPGDMFDGPLRFSLPLLPHAVEEHRRVFGDVDMWPYGFESNRAVLKAMTQYSYEQGLSERLVHPEELFAATTLEKSKR